MLRLSWDQVDRLEQLTLKRHAASISGVLAATWPALTERLQDRWPAFVEAAVQQGRKHGLRDARDLARYASLWCIWGPSFDGKANFAWAAEILSDPRRNSALKLHQLAHRTRDELQQRERAQGGQGGAGAAPPLTTAQFEAALTGVDQQVGQLAMARAVFPTTEPAAVLLKACDVGSIDLMVAEAEGLQEYRHVGGGWQRTAVPKLAEAPSKWTQAPEVSVEIALTSHPLRGGGPARLNLLVETVAVCDPKVHPEVVHQAAAGRLSWKGRDTARLSLALYAPTPVPPAPAALPRGIAAEAPFDAQKVQVSSCGVRDAGAPFGDVGVAVNVYPATQFLSEVRHPAWDPMVWPASSETPPPAAPTATCSLEKDGASADVAAWQRSWRGLNASFRTGLERLYNEWNKALDGQNPRLEVEASPLVGQAGLAWGYRRTSTSTVVMRTEAAIDLLALSIDLKLSGELVEGAARSRIRILCKGRTELRMAFTQVGDAASEAGSLKTVAQTWRFPFTLEIEPLAGAEPATLVAAAVPVPATGALLGACGLRPRPDAGGYEWYFELRMDAVAISTALSDPVLGSLRRTRRILPDLPLVEWSAG